MAQCTNAECTSDTALHSPNGVITTEGDHCTTVLTAVAAGNACYSYDFILPRVFMKFVMHVLICLHGVYVLCLGDLLSISNGFGYSTKSVSLYNDS